MEKKVIHIKKNKVKKSIVSFLCLSVLSSSAFPYQIFATENVEIINSQDQVDVSSDQNNSDKSETLEKSPVDDNLEEVKDGREAENEVAKETENEGIENPDVEIPDVSKEESAQPVEAQETRAAEIIEEENPEVSLEENRENAWNTFISATQDVNTMRMRAVSPTEAFINSVALQAKQVASSNGLYASVMIAQAALESNWGRSSLSTKPNYNLFGIKGSYNGSSVAMKTQEYSKLNGWYTVIANFRKYPSYSESLQDNANLLRKGVNYNHGIYSGAWLENTTTYTQATDHLEGIYATDPTYDTKLNSIIERYNLTQYDSYNSVTSSNRNSYNAKLRTVDIYSRPKGMYNAIKVNNSGLSVNSGIKVKQEMRTQSGVFAKIYNNDNKFIGWINKEMISTYDTILGSKSKKYIKRVKTSTNGIYNKPYNLEGSKMIDDGSTYKNKYVQIQQEMITQSGVYGKAYLSGTFIGWIGISDLTYDTNLSSKPKNYRARVSNNLTGIYTKPFMFEGSKLTVNSNSYVGKNVIISQEMRTQSGTYAKIYYDNQFIGWINIKELVSYDINLESKSKSYDAILPEESTNIYNKPYNMKGSQLIANASHFANKDVHVVQEMRTQSGTYAKITYKKNIIGWVNVSDLTYDKNLGSTKRNYSTTVKNTYDSIFTKPKFFKSAKPISKSGYYANKEVHVKQLIKTAHGNYMKIYTNSKMIGWIHENDLN